MKFWAGESPNDAVKIKHNYVMDSVINYYNKEDPKIKYKYKRLFLDNGAFSALKNIDEGKNIDLNKDRVLDVQETLKPTHTVPLDYPFTPNMDQPVMQKRWDKTKENVDYWIETSQLDLVPALHAWNIESLKENIKWFYKKDFDYISLGSVLTSKEEFSGFFGDRQPSKTFIDSIITAQQIANEYGLKIHIFGFGSSPIMYHIGAFCGLKSTDSIGYKRKAAYGKIILPQTGERYCGNGEATFGNGTKKEIKIENFLSKEDINHLENCECPICKNLPKSASERWENLRHDWVKRTYHNKWVMEKEEIIAEMYMDDKVEYTKFLDDTIGKSGLNHLWEYAKRRLNHYKIDLLY
jgi:7-cyano-7-deazaguanine tRNA-ribosyltransferase